MIVTRQIMGHWLVHPLEKVRSAKPYPFGQPRSARRRLHGAVVRHSSNWSCKKSVTALSILRLAEEIARLPQLAHPHGVCVAAPYRRSRRQWEPHLGVRARVAPIPGHRAGERPPVDVRGSAASNPLPASCALAVKLSG